MVLFEWWKSLKVTGLVFKCASNEAKHDQLVGYQIILSEVSAKLADVSLFVQLSKCIVKM
jgi:hypothetical protein